MLDFQIENWSWGPDFFPLAYSRFVKLGLIFSEFSVFETKEIQIFKPSIHLQISFVLDWLFLE